MCSIGRIVLNSIRTQGYKQLNIFNTDKRIGATHFSSSSSSGCKGSDNKDDGGQDYQCEPCEPSKSSNPSAPTCYDLRKFGHNLPVSNVNLYFEPLPNIPTGVFRNTDNEVLGFGAGKSCAYKNPEYFSFHHMSYYDMHLIMRCFRQPSPKTGRKP